MQVSAPSFSPLTSSQIGPTELQPPTPKTHEQGVNSIHRIICEWKNKVLATGWARAAKVGSHIYHESVLNMKLPAHLSPPIVVLQCKCESPSRQETIAFVLSQENK